MPVNHARRCGRFQFLSRPVRCDCDRNLSPGARRLGVEWLEDRRLLSASLGQPAIELFDVSPALFVENQGQWPDESVRYAFNGSGATILHTDAGPVFQLFQREAVEESQEGWLGQSEAVPQDPHDPLPGASLRSATSHPSDPIGALHEPEEAVTLTTQFSVTFDGAERVEPVGLDRAETVFNYYLGEQSNWRSNVPGYATVAYPGLYDGIDLLTFGRRDSLKYEFHVAPGADWRAIQISYEGIQNLWLDAAGALHVETELGELIDDAPYIYQQIAGQQIEVSGTFTLLDADTYTFEVSGPYDPSLELIIDPELAWSTYLGGIYDDHGRGIAVDASGNVLVTGRTYSSGWIAGGYDATFNGMWDAFVIKLSPDGAHLWSTYLGGSDADYGHSIAVDASGNVLVTSLTFSYGWTAGGYDTSYDGGVDAFVAKLSPSGTHLWSTYLGGSSGDYGYAIAVDASGNVLVTGETYSSGWTARGYDTTHNGGYDAFVAKLSPSGAHLWSTYLGGSSNDRGDDIAVDASGNVLVTGRTYSSGWTAGGYDITHNGGTDAFVAKLSPTGAHLWSTYLGGSNTDSGYGIAVDASGNALVTGLTSSSGWIAVGYDATHNGSGDAFVAKLSPGGTHLWSTYLGGSSTDEGRGIAVDASGNVLVTGSTNSSGWTAGGHDITHNGDMDAFVAKLSPTGAHLWSTYLGGSGTDEGRGIAVDASGNVLVTGETESSGWTAGGYDTTHNGRFDAFVAKLRDLTSVVGRHLFYNRSPFDGSNPQANDLDDNALAFNKAALLPGETVSADNYTNYHRGINGLMIDVDGLPEGFVPAAGDFLFLTGNNDLPGDWTAAPAPVEVVLREGAGDDGSDRITIIWDDYAIQNEWLQVTVLAERLGLVGDDVFYFGNAVGETGNSAADARVSVVDLLLTRNNPRGILDPAGIDCAYDFNRDGRVNATDVLLARNSQTNFLDALELLDLPNPQQSLVPTEVGPEAMLSDIAWIGEYEHVRSSSRPARKHNPAAETVDKLLATYRP